MAHLSYSQVETLLTCGEKYRLTRIVGIPEDPAWWFLGGSAVHTATEKHDLGVDAPAEDLFASALLEQMAELPDGAAIRASGRATKEWPGGEDEAWWRHHGPQFVQAWIDWRAKNPNLQLADINGQPAVEVAVAARTHNSVDLKGYIDRIFQDTESGDLLIVDLKTGRNAPSSSLQMDFYRYSLQHTLGLQARHGGFWMARQGVISKIHDLWRTDAQIEDMLHKSRILIDNDIFIPHLGMLCGSCGVKEFCSAYTPGLSTHTVIDREVLA